MRGRLNLTQSQTVLHGYLKGHAMIQALSSTAPGTIE